MRQKCTKTPKKSSSPHRNPEIVQGVVSRVSSPSLPPAGCSSHVLHSFLQEQQKIVSGFRAQPWPMQMKIAAVKSATHSIVFTAKVFWGECVQRPRRLLLLPLFAQTASCIPFLLVIHHAGLFHRSHKGNINKHTSQLKMADYCRSCVSKVGRKVRLKLQVLLEVMTLWRSIIKRIEGQF
jgi:hypothetical protein